MITWTGLAPWEFEFLTYTFLVANLVSGVFNELALIHDAQPGKEGCRTNSCKSQLFIIEHGLYPPAVIPSRTP